MLQRYLWSKLNTQQVGAYTEYFVKMELTMYGFQVFETEVDDRGIDFIARYETGPFLQIQVKSLRSLGYVFMPKMKFSVDESTYLAFGLLVEGHAPDLYLIPATRWRDRDSLFVDYDYKGLKSKPEYGLSLSVKKLPALAPYAFATTVERLVREGGGTDSKSLHP